jgi:apolipoprotein N-acyltransferase
MKTLYFYTFIYLTRPQDMKRIHLLLLSLGSGVLFALSWPANGFSLLILVAMVPLLVVENHLLKTRPKFFGSGIFVYSYLAFFIWNLLTTWWIYNSSFFGAAMAVLLNSLFQATVFSLFHLSRRTLARPSRSYFVLIAYWITWEYFHLDWDLSFPWLNLGNVFASSPKFVQWYEYTGAFGGSIWILLVNIAIFKRFEAYIQNQRASLSVRKLILPLALIFLPLIISLSRYYTYTEKSDPYSFVVVQPNIDPYEEKYGGMPYPKQIHLMLSLAREKVDKETDFVIFPESAIQEPGIWEHQLSKSYSLDSVVLFLQDNPHLSIIIGASTYRMFEPGQKLNRAARKHKLYEDFWFSAHNAAIFIDTVLAMDIYHKSKLVAGVEMMPFPKILKAFEKFALDMGGTVGTIGGDQIRKCFTPVHPKPGIASAICYESAYGEFFAGFVRNGAQLMTVITNDGWWGNTPGHRQHMAFSSLRAIETRRSIARSANTGISAFVNQRGDVLQPTTYWEPAVIKNSLNANDKITFYVRYGDFLARFAALASVLLVLISLVSHLMKRKSGLNT